MSSSDVGSGNKKTPLGNDGFILTSSPHAFGALDTRTIMYAVGATLLPAAAMSVVLFGARTLVLYLVGITASVATEAITKIARGRSPRTTLDGSAFVTGLLLVMTLPPTVSPAAVIIGAVVAVFIGKEVFGGLGSNILNPALVGRAFLAAAYPVGMTTWSEPARVFGFLPAPSDALSGATPLAAAKFDHISTPLFELLFGRTAGSMGETSVILLALGGIVLIATGIARWPVVVSLLGSVFLFGEVFHLIDSTAYPSGLFHLLSGGVALGAFFMATDPATTPITDRGGVIFGVGAGFLIIVIRLFGGFPEGVMYSILLMNAVTPIIDRYANARTFGSSRNERGVKR